MDTRTRGPDLHSRRRRPPACRFLWSGDPTFPPAEAQLIVCNPTREPITVNALLDLVRNNMPELKEEKTLALQPGASQTLRLAIAENDPTTVFNLSVRVTSADGKIVYYDRQTKWPRARSPAAGWPANRRRHRRWTSASPIILPNTSCGWQRTSMDSLRTRSPRASALWFVRLAPRRQSRPSSSLSTDSPTDGKS